MMPNSRSTWRSARRLLARLKTTTVTDTGTSSLLSSSSMTSFACCSLNPPDPAPINGNATDRKLFSWVSRTACRTESRIDRSDALQSRLIPATWMIALKGSLPADVRTAPPSGIGPSLPSSRNGPVPPRFLTAPETPWGRSSHQGMTLRFQAFTITSTGWSRRSPSTTTAFMKPPDLQGTDPLGHVHRPLVPNITPVPC